MGGGALAGRVARRRLTQDRFSWIDVRRRPVTQKNEARDSMSRAFFTLFLSGLCVTKEPTCKPVPAPGRPYCFRRDQGRPDLAGVEFLQQFVS
jgi:hypothetical protein